MNKRARCIQAVQLCEAQLDAARAELAAMPLEVAPPRPKARFTTHKEAYNSLYPPYDAINASHRASIRPLWSESCQQFRKELAAWEADWPEAAAQFAATRHSCGPREPAETNAIILDAIDKVTQRVAQTDKAVHAELIDIILDIVSGTPMLLGDLDAFLRRERPDIMMSVGALQPFIATQPLLLLKHNAEGALLVKAAL